MGERGLRHGAVAVVSALVAVQGTGALVKDWLLLHAAGLDLLRDPLAVYTGHPKAQSGPLALLLSALPRPVFVVAVASLLGVFTWLLERHAGVRVAMVGAVLLLAPWAMFAVSGHADDPLVLLGAAVMLLGLRDARAGVASAGFVLAVAAKPTAILLAPVLMLGGGFTVWAALVPALVWGPFAVADPAALAHAGRGVSYVWFGSLLHLLGYEPWHPIPVWVRPTQLGVGLALASLLARRGNYAGALVAAFAVRTLLEPGPWPAYAASLIALGLFCARPGAVLVPAVTLWVVSLWQSPSDVAGGVRVACLVAAMAAAQRPIPRRRALVHHGRQEPAAHHAATRAADGS